MNRNTVDYFSHIPVPHMPRTKQDLGYSKRLTTFKHGHLIPWYVRLVYPHSNLKMDMSCFIRLDTSSRVPLDDIYLDNYFFFVPLRLIDPNFEKILGHKMPYDNNVYNFPTLEIDMSASNGGIDHDSLLQYFGYGSVIGNYFKKTLDANNNFTGIYQVDPNETIFDKVNSYVFAAYYKVWNEYFRDENLDPEIPIADILSGNTSMNSLAGLTNSPWNAFKVLPVNRYHDIFSSGVVSPVKGGNGDVTIPLGFTQLPVVTGADHISGQGTRTAMHMVDAQWATGRTGQLVSDNGTVSTNTSSIGTVGYNLVPSNLWADASSATGPSVRQLYTSLALYSLYDKRGTFGTRLIEQIRGSFGLEVSDGLLNRTEYLGGSNQSLNNVPVLNTADDLGEMRGNSATLTGLNSFDKGFQEWGIVIGVSCTRVKHVYNQGINCHELKIMSNLDMYWPEFANIGKVGLKTQRIFNNPRYSYGADNNDTAIFNYVEPWIDQHVEIDWSSGDFGSFRGTSDDLATLWTYQDLYSSRPYFSASWLKEPPTNVIRTLSGLLVPDATKDKDLTTDYAGHQFMIRYNYHTQLTMPIPVRSEAPNITGRI